MKRMREILGSLYQDKITEETAAEQLAAKYSREQLATFIVDAYQQGWITNQNLGLDDAGDVV